MKTKIVALFQEGRRIVLGSRTVIQLVSLVFLLFLAVVVISFLHEITAWNVVIVVLGMVIVGILSFRLINKIPDAAPPDTPETTAGSLELAHWFDAVDGMEPIDKIELIRIFASASWRHHHIIEKLVRRFGLHSFTVNMLVRCDEGDTKRKDRIAANLQEWNELADEFHLTLNVKFYSFTYMIRGISIDDKFALMGYYIRDGEKTCALDEPVMVVRQGERLDDYLLKQFKWVHETLMKAGREEI